MKKISLESGEGEWTVLVLPVEPREDRYKAATVSSSIVLETFCVMMFFSSRQREMEVRNPLWMAGLK